MCQWKVPAGRPVEAYFYMQVYHIYSPFTPVHTMLFYAFIALSVLTPYLMMQILVNMYFSVIVCKDHMTMLPFGHFNKCNLI